MNQCIVTPGLLVTTGRQISSLEKTLEHLPSQTFVNAVKEFEAIVNRQANDVIKEDNTLKGWTMTKQQVAQHYGKIFTASRAFDDVADDGEVRLVSVLKHDLNANRASNKLFASTRFLNEIVITMKNGAKSPPKDIMDMKGKAGLLEVNFKVVPSKVVTGSEEDEEVEYLVDSEFGPGRKDGVFPQIAELVPDNAPEYREFELEKTDAAVGAYDVGFFSSSLLRLLF